MCHGHEGLHGFGYIEAGGGNRLPTETSRLYGVSHAVATCRYPAPRFSGLILSSTGGHQTARAGVHHGHRLVPSAIEWNPTQPPLTEQGSLNPRASHSLAGMSMFGWITSPGRSIGSVLRRL